MSKVFGGQLWICCHIIDYGFEQNDIITTSDLIEEIEVEISKVIELQICKNISFGELTLDILFNEQIYQINGWWEIRK